VKIRIRFPNGFDVLRHPGDAATDADLAVGCDALGRDEPVQMGHIFRIADLLDETADQELVVLRRGHFRPPFYSFSRTTL
jgi:hypothetical protein